MSDHDSGHIPVLLEEVLALLDPQEGETYVDCTLGLGGHAATVAGRIGPTGRIIGFDLDEANLAAATSRLCGADSGPEVEAVHGSFTRAAQFLRERGIEADMVLADLGFSSTQMDDPARGLSFRGDGPLDMRFDRSRGRTASDLVNSLPESELADLIFRLGEDPMARRIARKLVEARRVSPIESTAALARLVRAAYGSRARASRMDPATRTFMALRIAVNDELAALGQLLEGVEQEVRRLGEADAVCPKAAGWLRPGARVAVIAFHSLEDRMVKRSFATLAREHGAELLTRRPVTACEQETRSNPRARSAKLRAIRAPHIETSRRPDE